MTPWKARLLSRSVSRFEVRDAEGCTLAATESLSEALDHEAPEGSQIHPAGKDSVRFFRTAEAWVFVPEDK